MIIIFSEIHNAQAYISIEHNGPDDPIITIDLVVACSNAATIQEAPYDIEHSVQFTPTVQYWEDCPAPSSHTCRYSVEGFTWTQDANSNLGKYYNNCQGGMTCKFYGSQMCQK